MQIITNIGLRAKYKNAFTIAHAPFPKSRKVLKNSLKNSNSGYKCGNDILEVNYFILPTLLHF